MALTKLEDIGNGKTEHYIALYGEMAVEGVVDLS
jgi:hypothetical protein